MSKTQAIKQSFLAWVERADRSLGRQLEQSASRQQRMYQEARTNRINRAPEKSGLNMPQVLTFIGANAKVKA